LDVAGVLFEHEVARGESFMSWLGESHVGELNVAPADQELVAFVSDHYDRLIRLAALVCHDVGDVEDAVQTALERAWRSRRTLREQDRMKPWLDRIVVREAIRSGRRRVRFLGRLSSLPREINVEGVGLDSARLAAPGSGVDLRIAYESLPAAQRAVVALHLYAGYSVVETAAIVGVPLETARSRLRLARDRLRAQLREVAP
jgi:RNA polymerase sigma-70 factor (ECF subfamily)